MAFRFDSPAAKFDQGLTMDSPVTPVSARKQMKNVIKLSLSRFGILALIGYLQKIVLKMTNSTKFASLAAKTTALDTAVKALDTANTNYEGAKKTTDQLMILRDNARIVAENAAQDLATGAEGVSKDPGDLTGGGWDVVGDHSPVGPMSAPNNFSATGGDDAGSVDLACDPQYGVQTHVAEYATAADGPYTSGYVGKKSSCTITGLPSGGLHWFRMRAVGAAGPGPWAGPISKRAT